MPSVISAAMCVTVLNQAEFYLSTLHLRIALVELGPSLPTCISLTSRNGLLVGLLSNKKRFRRNTHAAHNGPFPRCVLWELAF